MQKITPFLWFDKQAEEAMNFYVSILKNSKIVSIKRYPDGPLEGPMKGMEGKVLTGVFELEGQRFMALDGGPYFKPSGAVSFYVECERKRWTTIGRNSPNAVTQSPNNVAGCKTNMVSPGRLFRKPCLNFSTTLTKKNLEE
jgi:predicted 3-demethylubiquinone-9 3-methyltransferase (glyoxalase superfamily)